MVGLSVIVFLLGVLSSTALEGKDGEKIGKAISTTIINKIR